MKQSVKKVKEKLRLALDDMARAFSYCRYPTELVGNGILPVQFVL